MAELGKDSTRLYDMDYCRNMYSTHHEEEKACRLLPLRVTSRALDSLGKLLDTQWIFVLLVLHSYKVGMRVLLVSAQTECEGAR